jgi:Protein of unknown function (DUF3592)
MKKPIKKMAWIMTFGLAYCFFSLSVVFIIWQLIFIQNAAKVIGKVVDMESLPKIRSHDQYAPVVEFETESKEKIVLKTQVFDYPPNFKVGEEVTVFYQSSNPQYAKISHFRHLWFWSAVWGGIGLFFLIVGFLSPNARGF